MKNLIYTLFAAVIFAGCTKTADIEVPQNPPMMAAFSFLEAGSRLIVEMEEVVPVFSQVRQDPRPIEGAHVQIIYGNQVFDLIEAVGQQPGYYFDTSTHRIIPGGHYELRVTKNGFPSLSAECTVPDYLPSSVRFDYSAVPDPSQGSDSIRRIGFYWQDQPGVVNYYRYSAEAKLPNFREAVVEFSSQNLTDKGKAGQELFSGLGSFYIDETHTPISSLSCTFDLKVMDEHASAYMQSFESLYHNGDNPFGEPVIAYTNIKGGLGVFGAYSRKFFNLKIY